MKPNYLKDKISPFSPGFRAINNNTVELTGGGKDKVEGAQWSRGFTSGKHVIEFIFPIHLRTVHSRVGLAPEGTKLGGNDLKRVVGGRGSWAIDLKASALFQNGKNIGSFPSQRVSNDCSFCVTRKRDLFYREIEGNGYTFREGNSIKMFWFTSEKWSSSLT